MTDARPAAPRSATELAAAYRATSSDPVAELDACLARIAAVDGQLGAVLAIDARVLDAARASERRLRTGRPRSPLEGVPVLLKDNVETATMPTTAGSRLLAGIPNPAVDAPLVVRLRRAGALVIGKVNLSEWSNFRSTSSTSGWSGVGGQTRNPHVLDRDPSGSSSGSAAAVAAGLAPLAVGTETDGSILSPAANCGIVGVKPTLGLVSRAGIVPVTAEQDTAGPMARTVADAAEMLAVLAGADRADPATGTGAAGRARRELAALVAEGSGDRAGAGQPRGRRIGVWRPRDGAESNGADAGSDGSGPRAETARAGFESVLDRLGGAGFVLVDVAAPPIELVAASWTAMVSEFRRDLDRYLGGRRGAPANLEQVVEDNLADPLELSRFGQELMLAALKAPRADSAEIRDARERARAAARGWVSGWADGPGACVAVVASGGPVASPLVYAEPAPGSRSDAGAGASSALPEGGRIAAWSPAAVAGSPSVTIPVGVDGPLPLGLTVLGPRFADANLLRLAAELESLVGDRIDPEFLPTWAAT